MSILDRMMRRLLPRHPQPVTQVTSDWLPYDPDAALYAREGDVPTIRPINIRRVELQRTFSVMPDDTVQVTLTDEFGTQKLPVFTAARAIAVDHVVRFEVIDHFGVDVGLGFILGQAKR